MSNVIEMAAGRRANARTYEKRSVYVIASDRRGPVKIGIAGNPQKRLRELQTANPQTLQIFHAVECGWLAEAVEKAAHNRLGADRAAGEWFHTTVGTAIAVVNAERYANRDVEVVDDLYWTVKIGAAFKRWVQECLAHQAEDCYVDQFNDVLEDVSADNNWPLNADGIDELYDYFEDKHKRDFVLMESFEFALRRFHMNSVVNPTRATYRTPARLLSRLHYVSPPNRNQRGSTSIPVCPACERHFPRMRITCDHGGRQFSDLATVEKLCEGCIERLSKKQLAICGLCEEVAETPFVKVGFCCWNRNPEVNDAE